MLGMLRRVTATASAAAAAGRRPIGVAAPPRELAAARVWSVAVGRVSEQVEDELQHLGERDDRHADPEPELTADVGQQLARGVVFLFDCLDDVRVGDVDVETGEVAHRLPPVAVVEVALVKSLLLGVRRIGKARRVVCELHSKW
jgi:hypothetical protein